MAKEIKQKSRIKDIRTIDRAAVLSAKMRKQMVKAKSGIESSAVSRGDTNPSGYADDKISKAARETGYASANTVKRLVKGKLDKSANPAPPRISDKTVRYSNTTQGKGTIKTKEYVRRSAERVRRGKPTAQGESIRNAESTSAKSAQVPSAMIKSKQADMKTKSVATTSRQKVVHVTGSQAGASHSAAKSKAIRDSANRKMAQKAAKQKAAKTAKRTKESLARMVKAITAAMKSLVAALGAGGSVILFIVILIIIIGAIVASPFGIFFSNDGADGTTMKEAAAQLNDEFSAEVQKIEDEIAHDELEIVPNGGFIDWKEVIAVYACKVSEDSDNPLDVVSIDDNKLSILRTAMFDMNSITYETKSVTKDRTVTTTDEEGNEVQETESVTITVLVITIVHKAAAQMADDYDFSKSQKDSLAELLDPTNDDLWAELIGGYSSGGGSGEPSKDRVPKGIFAWPLEVQGTITSWFGYRKDPITGEVKYHSGTDIAVPEGTPILAAADGTVSVANGADSYGGGYGYYVKIWHNDIYDSLYAHCRSIAVKKGDTVKQGQIIGYVGTTGRSTGSHLHFEIYMNGTRTDALSYFE